MHHPHSIRVNRHIEFILGNHYTDVVMGTIASQITSLTIVYSTVYSDADQRKHQSSASLAFVCGIHRGPVNSPHKWPVMFPFDDVIMKIISQFLTFLNTEMVQLVEIVYPEWPWLVYPIQPILWLVMAWRHQQSELQQAWYWTTVKSLI